MTFLSDITPPMGEPRRDEPAAYHYRALIKRIKLRVKALEYAEHDPSTGVSRYYFDGKLERTVHNRNYDKR